MKVLVYNNNLKTKLVVGQLLKELGFNVIITDSTKDFIEKIDMSDLDLIFVGTEPKKFPPIIEKILKYKRNAYCLLSINSKDIFCKTEALFKGIDDYIYNDFTLEELSAKIKAIKRIIMKKNGEEIINELSIYDLTLNTETREVKRAGKEILLTNKEFSLLEYFLRNKNRVLTRIMIAEKIWDIDFITDSNIVDVYITFLRGKIDKDFEPKIIKTVRGIGFIAKEVGK